MSPVRTSDGSHPPLQSTPRDRWSIASFLQWLDTELHSEKRNIEFLQTAFQRLSYTIEGSFDVGEIHCILSKQLEDIRKEKKILR